MRKIVQIAVTSGSDGPAGSMGWSPQMVALDEDGNVWVGAVHMYPQWAAVELPHQQAERLSARQTAEVSDA